MAYVGHVDWTFADTPPAPSAAASGLARLQLVGREQGAVHTDLAAVVIHPGGWLAPHVHAFEEALYVLEGDLLLTLGDRTFRLVAGDYALMPTGLRHALGNTGSAPNRLLSLSSPMRQDPASGRRDTFFEAPQDLAAMDAAAMRPPFGDPTLRLVGHYDGTPPQAEALAVKDPARGRAPAGADTAILAYSGISVKMLVDRNFGADHVTMFTVDYELGGAAQQHDHPFEEAYFLPYARQFRAALRMPLILLGGINRRDTIERAMAEGFDFVAMGRALLREPDLVARLASGAAREGLCVHCNKCMPTIYRGTHCVLVAHEASRPG